MKLDATDIRIMRLLGRNPRNIAALAKELGLPAETIRYRVKRLVGSNFVKLLGVPNYPKLGLTLLWAFLEAKTSRTLEDLLDRCQYVNYMTRCYGFVNGYLLNFLAPRGKEDLVLEFFEGLRGEGLIKDYFLVPSLPVEYPLPDFDKYYDFEEGRWEYNWKGFLREALTHVEPSSVTVPEQTLLDWVDIMIIQKLQVEATVSLTELAKKLGLSIASVRYHFLGHVIGKGLVSFAVRYLPYAEIPLSLFILKPVDGKYIGNLLRSLKGKPFTMGVAVSPEGKALVLLFQAPFTVKLGFYQSLKHLMDAGIVESYFEVILDNSFYRKYSIPDPKYYKCGEWVFERIYVPSKAPRLRGEEAI